MARNTTLTAPASASHRIELIFAGPAVLKQPRSVAAPLITKGGETR